MTIDALIHELRRMDEAGGILDTVYVYLDKYFHALETTNERVFC